MPRHRTTRTANQRDYDQAKSKQLGDLHQRMKFLIEVAKPYEEVLPGEVWHAIWDLKDEVENYKPARPPFGRRLQRI